LEPLILLLDYVSTRERGLIKSNTANISFFTEIAEVKTQLRNRFLSGPRYNRYLTATTNNSDRAKKLYNGNIRLAQAFHPVLSQFEVVFRNSLNMVLSSHFSDPDWIITQQAGFMRHPSLRASHFFLKSCVQKTENKLRARAIPVTSGKIIADQTFGFWVAFFLSHHYSLVAGQPIHVFPHKPSIENRAGINSRLEDIKNFRNRVNHCEPICFSGSTIDCSVALSIRRKIYELVSWIDPGLVPFFSSIDNIQNKAAQIMRI
jgi:hypothetical protein